MAQPLTTFETAGTWTTRLEAEAFIDQIAGETDLTVSQVGESSLGYPIRLARLGTAGKPRILFVGGQHGIELSGREAALCLFRDLAYSTDGADTDFLAEHEIFLIPEVNADRVDPPRSRYNAGGVDLNRDHLLLSQSETKAVRDVIEMTDPHLIVDMHEIAAGNYDSDITFTLDSPLRSHHFDGLAEDLFDHLTGSLVGTEYTGEKFVGADTPAPTFRNVSAAHHALFLLTEASQGVSTSRRFESHKIVLRAVKSWVTLNAVTLEAAKSVSRAADISGESPLFVPAGEWSEIADPGYYVLDPESPLPDPVLSLHGIETVDGKVFTAQKSRAIIPAFFDPRSSLKQFPASLPPQQVRERSDQWQGWKKIGVTRQAIKSIWVKKDGERYSVKKAYKKADDIIHGIGAGT